MVSLVLTILALLLATMVLILLEILTPFFGVLAALSLLTGGGAIYLAFTINSWAGLLTTLAVVVGMPLYAWQLVKHLPNTRLGRRVFLAEAPPADATDGTPEVPELRGLIGHTGTAETLLRPSGSVRIEGRRFSAMSEEGVIQQGRAVRVVGISGTEVVVRAVEPA